MPRWTRSVFHWPPPLLGSQPRFGQERTKSGRSACWARSSPLGASVYYTFSSGLFLFSFFFYIPCIVKIKKKKKIVGSRFRKWVVTKSDYYLVRKSVTDKLWQPITRENNVFFRNSTQSPWTIAKLLCRSTVYFAENFAEKAFVFSDDFMFYLVDFRIV